jgi:NAD(P)-dependent dehydrogenase (short-subunit alcohol dehydrogenase family)
LANEGADVVVADIVIEPANEVVNGINALGRKAIAVKADITKKNETRQLAKAALDEFGKIDILVNNAGGSSRDKQKPFHESNEALWDYVIGLNMKGTFHCTRAVINHMMERRAGKIVNIASIAGMIGEPGMADYSASKAGIIGFTMALAKEVAPFGINVNCISPGEIQTRWTVTSKEEKYMRLIGLGRLGKPEEIAATVVFLVSDAAAFITGQNHGVCGLWNIGGL